MCFAVSTNPLLSACFSLQQQQLTQSYQSQAAAAQMYPSKLVAKDPAERLLAIDPTGEKLTADEAMALMDRFIAEKKEADAAEHERVIAEARRSAQVR